MSVKQVSVQNVFLDNVRSRKIPMTVFLINGIKLQGIVGWYDDFSIILKHKGNSQLVYKHGISTMMPVDSFNLSSNTPNQLND